MHAAASSPIRRRRSSLSPASPPKSVSHFRAFFLGLPPPFLILKISRFVTPRSENREARLLRPCLQPIDEQTRRSSTTLPSPGSHGAHQRLTHDSPVSRWQLASAPSILRPPLSSPGGSDTGGFTAPPSASTVSVRRGQPHTQAKSPFPTPLLPLFVLWQ